MELHELRSSIQSELVQTLHAFGIGKEFAQKLVNEIAAHNIPHLMIDYAPCIEVQDEQ